MAIYTKTGDKGLTKVFSKKTKELVAIGKDSCKIEVIGNIDELNSFLGIIKSSVEDNKLQVKIEEIQSNLFTVNSIIAGGNLKFSSTQTKKLEREIDKLEAKLPVQKNFIYYGGSFESSLVFYARSICRRAERSLVSFSKINKEEITANVFTYLNRLSDYLFILARNINFEIKKSEKSWKR